MSTQATVQRDHGVAKLYTNRNRYRNLSNATRLVKNTISQHWVSVTKLEIQLSCSDPTTAAFLGTSISQTVNV
jgi:hypothetical protein